MGNDRTFSRLPPARLALALLVIRLTAGAFLLVWASLKFFRPEWMVNVFRNTYGIASAEPSWAYWVGAVQVALVVLFILGLARRLVYPLVTLMHATGVIGVALGGALWNFTDYPNNLLWTSVATLGALIALSLMAREDEYTIGAWLAEQRREVRARVGLLERSRRRHSCSRRGAEDAGRSHRARASRAAGAAAAAGRAARRGADARPARNPHPRSWRRAGAHRRAYGRGDRRRGGCWSRSRPVTRRT